MPVMRTCGRSAATLGNLPLPLHTQDLISPRYASRGLYDQQLAYWRSVYPADYFCVVSFEMLLAKPVWMMRVVSAFIGLREYDWLSVHKVGNNSRAATVCLVACLSTTRLM
jgi:hypothetical protein